MRGKGWTNPFLPEKNTQHASPVSSYACQGTHKCIHLHMPANPISWLTQAKYKIYNNSLSLASTGCQIHSLTKMQDLYTIALAEVKIHLLSKKFKQEVPTGLSNSRLCSAQFGFGFCAVRVPFLCQMRNSVEGKMNQENIKTMKSIHLSFQFFRHLIPTFIGEGGEVLLLLFMNLSF